MLHKLALAASSQTPSLIKEAIPSEEQQRLVANNLEQKARYMGRARGVKVPKMPRPDTGPLFKPVEGPSYGGILQQRANPQIENIRMGNPTDAASSTYKKSPLLLEKEIQKAHGTVSQSPLKQLRHRSRINTRNRYE